MSVIPRRLRRRQPKPIPRLRRRQPKPLTAEQVRDIEARWVAKGSPRPQILWNAYKTVKEITR